ncbi:hypothetical protein DXC30_02165 [Butyribacter intestini]|jgi:hypothetical protein|uniref:Uncharacterized protein n=2 Tax=Butyribacter intestini TaxID=1703332 RepID=A0AAW3JVF7_9FIRM|nr:hypothetical protein APZ18_02125 [Butyribacter intestini]RHU77117.1 hypothetical protein DXC30_02165 [Butyribacter intestini]CDB89344.1 unknown [Clostridium sp. CAG:253]DAF01884.1 MAG TPA: hypothetical protein [Bacteriophage sp.]
MDMTELEKRDMLIELLSTLYRIKADNKEENKTLDYEITVTEQRLTAMGYNDFSKLKLEKAD